MSRFSLEPKCGLVRTVCLSLAIWLVSGAGPVSACSVCFGDPNSDLVQGARAGIIFLGVMVYGLLMMIGGVGAFWYLRAKKLGLLGDGIVQSQAETVPMGIPANPPQ